MLQCFALKRGKVRNSFPIPTTWPKPGQLTRNSHFAFPATTIYRQLPLLRSFSAFVPEPKNRTRPAEPLPEPKGRDLPHFEAISQTPLPQLPSVVQIGFAFLLSLPGWQRQSLHAPQHVSEQAPRQMAFCQQ
jgi:hypothetical protein